MKNSLQRIRVYGKYIFCLLLSFLFYTSSFSQVRDTAVIDSSILRHSPAKATLYSAVIPGLGQLYNKKYWKIPVIWGGLITTGYFIKSNNDLYVKYKQAFDAKSANDSVNDPFHGKYAASDLLNAREFYRRNRDLSIIIAVGVYALNIVDAAVDAHLFYFDVSDKLGFRWQPQPFLIGTSIGNGLCLNLYFKK